MGTACRMLARRRDLRLLLSAGMVSLSGDWILRIGLIYRVYVVTGSTVVSALIMASSFAPQVLLGAVAGVYADRWDRKRTMIAANLLLAAGLLPLLLVHGAGGVWIGRSSGPPLSSPGGSRAGGENCAGTASPSAAPRGKAGRA